MPSSSHQQAEFERQFRAKYRDDFQSWFADLAKLLHPGGDLQRVRVTQGDGGLDCVSLNQGRVYQCYAPARFNETKDSETAAKIREDFATAHSTMGGALREWVFVHNHPQGEIGQLSAAAAAEIHAKTGVTILIWGISELWNAFAHLPKLTLAQAFGSDASQFDVLAVSLDDLQQVISRLEAMQLPLQVNTPEMPDVRKLEFNNLTACVQANLLSGRVVEPKVEQLFSQNLTDVQRGERVAEGFRRYYASMRDNGTEANRMFDLLLDYAGWAAQGSARRNTAVLGVLSYFFHRCDIFENPPR